MRRIKAMAVILALMATPLALYARAMACEACACNMTCCITKHTEAQPKKNRLCGEAFTHSGSSGECTRCPMKSGKQVPDFGLTAPIAPTTPGRFATLDAPATSRRMVYTSTAVTPAGFILAPFEPPRA